MSVPGIVQSHLDGETIAAEVGLGGEDRLFVTPTRTLIYRAEGLLSDESVEEYPHSAERVDVSKGRRKSKVHLEYGLDDPREFAVPTKRLEDVLHPVLAGVLNAAGVTDPGETVAHTYRFSELTLVITSARVVKHVGQAVWDDEFEEFHYADVTGLDFEEGSVATQVVLKVAGRPQRIKAPNEQARALREHIQSALFAYHGVSSIEEFEATVGTGEDDPAERPAPEVSFGDGPDPLDVNPARLTEQPANAAVGSGTADEPAGDGLAAEPRRSEISELESEPKSKPEPVHDSTGTDTDETGREHSVSESSFEGSGFEAAHTDAEDETAAQLAALTRAVERQNELLSAQRRVLEQLVDELSPDR